MSETPQAPIGVQEAIHSGNMPQKKLSWLIWLVSIAGGFVLLAMLAIFGCFLYINGQYQNAEASAKTKDFNAAVQSLNSVPDFYKDTKSFRVYSKAGLLLATGEYDEAKSLFQSLGTYKDSATMIQEADYQAAQSYLDKNDYESAIQGFAALEGYKDSASKLKTASDALYALAVDAYRSKKYDAAKNDFILLKLSHSDADKYLVLIQAHSASPDQSYADAKALYTQLLSVGNFEDAIELKLSSQFILYFLVGKWLLDGNEFMTFTYSKSKSKWFMDDLEAGKDFEFQDSTFLVFKDGNWVEYMQLGYTDDNTLQYNILVHTQSTPPIGTLTRN